MIMRRKKFAFIGSGNIGGLAAFLVAQKSMGDVVLFDIDLGVAKGKALDIAQSLAILGGNASVAGTNNYQDLKDSDVVIVTAGSPRKPGMSRDDLLKINSTVITSVAEGISKNCPDAFVIVVTNPLDVMVWVMQVKSKLPTTKVVGMAGILDAARYSYFLAQALNISVESVKSIVLGGHGDLMVPILSGASVNGVPLVDLVTKGLITTSEIEKIMHRTRLGGGEIVDLMKAGSAFHAPAAACVQMAQSYLFDERKLLPCAAYLNGEYGYQGIYAGVPVIIGKNGVEKVIELPLSPEEALAFQNSIQAVKILTEDVAKLEP